MYIHLVLILFALHPYIRALVVNVHTSIHMHDCCMYMYIHTCENCAKLGSQNIDACPMSSWHTSGSGVYIGLEGWRMYCVEWNTRNANPAKKSRDESRPELEVKGEKN